MFQSVDLSINVNRVEKEYNQRMATIISQREKVDETYRKKKEELLTRREDLIKQLIDMQNKFKERMKEIEERKQQLERKLAGKSSS